MNCGLTGIRSPPQYMRLRNTCATIVSPSPRPTLSCNCRRSFPPPSRQMLDQFRDCRDQIYAQAFDTLYSLPLVQAMTGQSLHDDAPPRPHPSETPEHRQYLAQELTRLEADIHSGGITEAVHTGTVLCAGRAARPTSGTSARRGTARAPFGKRLRHAGLSPPRSSAGFAREARRGRHGVRHPRIAQRHSA